MATITLSMRTKLIVVIEWTALPLLLFILLFGQPIYTVSPGWVGCYFRYVINVFLSATAGWTVLFVFTGCYFVTFVILERRLSCKYLAVGPEPFMDPYVRYFDHIFYPNAWLVALVVIGFLRCLLPSGMAMDRFQYISLIVCITFGKAAATWIRWDVATAEKRAGCLLCAFLVFLATSTFCGFTADSIFKYHGTVRWSGVWGNPNLYGLLMGVGVVLAIGLVIPLLRMTGCSLISRSFITPRRGILWLYLVCLFILLIIVIICCVGLLKSYSRGAWVSCCVGLSFLGFKSLKGCQFGARIASRLLKNSRNH